MSKATGTITGGTAADLLTEIHDTLTAHSAWSHVKDVTISTSVYKVYKCDGLENDWGSDFFIAVVAADQDHLSFMAFEEFNDTTDQATNMVFLGTGTMGTNAESAAASSNPTALNNNGTMGGGDSYPGALRVSNSSFDYYISVTANRLVVGTNGSPSYCGIYVGLYETFVTLANEFPLVISNITGNSPGSSSGARFSRHPHRVSQSAQGNTADFRGYGLTSLSANSGAIINQNGINPLTEGFTANVPAVAMNIDNAISLRGRFYDILVSDTESGPVIGDTFTDFDSVVYDVVATDGSFTLLVPADAD